MIRLLCGRSALYCLRHAWDLLPGVGQTHKPTPAQALIAQASVEALNAPVLHRLAPLDVHQLDLLLRTPSDKVTAGELFSQLDKLRKPSGILR